MFKKVVAKPKQIQLPTLLQAFILCKVTHSKLAGKTLLTERFHFMHEDVLLNKHHLSGLLKA